MKPLTEKELAVLQKAREGLHADEAAHQLGLSVSGRKWRLQNAKTKLNAKTTTHAVAEAMSQGLLQ